MANVRLVLIAIIALGIILLLFKGCGKEKPWEKEVSFQFFKTTQDGKLVPQGTFMTPDTIVYDSSSQVWTNGAPIAFWLPGETVPICYCSENGKPLRVNKRPEGPVIYTKPSKKCWKMCKNE